MMLNLPILPWVSSCSSAEDTVQSHNVWHGEIVVWVLVQFLTATFIIHRSCGIFFCTLTLCYISCPPAMSILGLQWGIILISLLPTVEWLQVNVLWWSEVVFMSENEGLCKEKKTVLAASVHFFNLTMKKLNQQYTNYLF